jgi:hypothetical protein
MAVCHPAHAGAQGFEAHEPKRGFHAKFFVEGLLRIADRTNGIFFWYDRIDLAEE